MSESDMFGLSEVFPATVAGMFAAVVFYPASYATDGELGTVYALIPPATFGLVLLKFRLERFASETKESNTSMEGSR